MRCPACTINIHEAWVEAIFARHNQHVFDKNSQAIYWVYRSMDCPECGKNLIQINLRQHQNAGAVVIGTWEWILPLHSARPPAPKEVPQHVAQDYNEACNVLTISPKASAALSRRCLQSMLHAHGYKSGNLAKEIDLILAETDPLKALPRKLRDTIDAIRNFGNFSAHPIDDRSSLMIIEVDPLEAEWCLEISEEMFEHFYVGPAEVAAKKAALNAKLQAAGKPPSK